LARRPLEGERKIIESAAAKAYRFLDLEFDGDAAGRRAVGIASFIECAGGAAGLRCGFKKRGIEWGAGRNVDEPRVCAVVQSGNADAISRVNRSLRLFMMMTEWDSFRVDTRECQWCVTGCMNGKRENRDLENSVAGWGTLLIPYIGGGSRLCRIIAEKDQFHG